MHDIARPRARNSSAKQVRVPKAAELVANQLRRRIILGELEEGDNLPPEASLIEEFGVSRPTMREAYRILETEDMVSVSRGSRGGAQIHLPRIDVVTRIAGLYLQSRKTSLIDVHNARLLIEPHSVRLLTERRPSKAIKELREIVSHLPSLLDRPDDYLHDVSEFHLKLIEGSGNGTLTLVGHVMCRIWEAHLINTISKRFVPQQAKEGIKKYDEILDHIEAGDADGAESLVREYIVRTGNITMRNLGKNSKIELLS